MTMVNACRRDIEDLLRQLRDNKGEFRSRYRARTSDLINAWKDLPEIERCAVSNNLTLEEWRFLLVVCRSAANASVEERDPSLLLKGLSALVFAAPAADRREWLIELTLLDYSAQKLSVSLEERLATIRCILTKEVESILNSFWQHGYRHIDAVEYVESHDKSGRFAYRQAW